MKNIKSLLFGILGGALAVVVLLTTAFSLDGNKVLTAYVARIQPTGPALYTGPYSSNVFGIFNATSNAGISWGTNASMAAKVMLGASNFNATASLTIITTNATAGGWKTNWVVNGIVCDTITGVN